MQKRFYSLLFLLFPLHLISQSIVINEIMADNQSTIADEDGDFPDWIELYNTSDLTINMSGLSLSDDETAKWFLPDLTLTSKGHLLIFASDKDRPDLLFWNTIVNQGDVWRYRPGDSQPPIHWADVDFDDSGWARGPSGFGYGDNDDATIITGYLSVYVRTSFFIDDLDAVKNVVLHIDFDDSFIAYVNGQEIARQNIGLPGEFVPYDRPADGGHEALLIQGQPHLRCDVDDLSVLRAGENVLAVQVHNHDIGSSDMSLIPFLSIGTLTRPESMRIPPDFLDLPGSFLHTNFKIKSEGETIHLFDAAGSVVDSARTPHLARDVSFARVPDGASQWQISALPTPGETNIDSVYYKPAAAPQFSHTGGLYDAPFTLSLTDTSGCDIYYTIDGSVPDESSMRYINPIAIDKTVCLRARCFFSPLQPSDIITHTFVFNEDTKFAVVALASDPYNLFDYDYGIFARGPNAESAYPYMGANFWQDWERPVHIEFYEPTGELGFALNAGMKVFGGWSRGRDQKSMAIFQRARYDSRQIDYQIFPQKSITHFESLILRNGGNDWTHTMFRDAFMQSLCAGETDLETMAYRPAQVYLNGEYWGILILREKINEHFLAANRGIDPDRVDILDREGREAYEIMAGSNADYLDLWRFIEQHDLSVLENYVAVSSRMDIDNFIDYEIAQIYFGNTDWPGNNIKYYRPQTPGSKWRWLIYDTDFGFHLYDDSYSRNTLEFATEPYGPSWPNPPWSTFLLRSLLESAHFERQFINRFADHMNTTFQADRVTAFLDDFDSLFGAEIHRQRQRWPGSVQQYNSALNRMYTFAERRQDYMQSFIQDMFDLKGIIKVQVDISPAGSGAVRINSKKLEMFPWHGEYFQDIPIDIAAIPASGYRFDHWDGSSEPDMNFKYDSHQNLNITAVFQQATDAAADLVINEINYNSGPDFPAKDWFELYNPGDVSLSLAGWKVRDGVAEHLWDLPSHAVIPARGYAVICTDTTFFKKVYSDASTVYGDMPFNLSNAGDSLYLYYGDQLVDSVFFDDQSDWPVEADGMGFTLELSDPESDNMNPEVWRASAFIGGTPIRSNSTKTHVEQAADVPLVYSMRQNYPNPFNNSTTIEFTLAQPGLVKLVIYDIRGRHVETLINKSYPAGVHNTTWHADAPSGVYFCRLEVTGEQSFTHQQKLLLIK